jgi:hypothetical protein
MHFEEITIDLAATERLHDPKLLQHLGECQMCTESVRERRAWIELLTYGLSPLETIHAVALIETAPISLVDGHDRAARRERDFHGD